MAFAIKVKMVPGDTEIVTSYEEISVKEAVLKAGVSKPENWNPKVGGEEVPWTRRLEGDATITLLKKKIKGNS